MRLGVSKETTEKIYRNFLPKRLRTLFDIYPSLMEAYNYVEASLGMSRYYSIHEGGRKGNGWSEYSLSANPQNI